MMPLRPKRILIVNDSLNSGGAERVAVDIANSLDETRNEVQFCSTRVGGPLKSQLRSGIPVTILGRSARWDVAKLVKFAHFVESNQFDVLHSHGRGTMKFVALCRRLGLISSKHVFHDHFGWLHVNRGADRGLKAALASGVDAYIGVDERLCEWAHDVAGVSRDRINLVRSGVDVSRFTNVEPHDLRKELRIPDGTLMLLMVANFRPQKDHPTLLRAIADLPEESRERLRLVVCGSTSADPGYHAKCVEMIDRLGIGNLVHLIGARDDPPALLAGSDAAILSSKNETGPLVVLEYMASSLPFIATDTGQITAAVRDLGVGFIPAPRDHHEMADALKSLLDLTAEERRAMGERGRRAVEQQFSLAGSIGKIESIYESVLNETRR